MAGELAAEWIKIPDGNGNLQKVWIRDSTARRDIAQLQTDVSGLVIPDPSDAAPQMDGTAAAGSSADYSRADHVHPTDTSRQAALSQAQLDAANSGITAAKVAAYDAIQVPTKTSELTNDSGFITASDIPTIPTASAALPAMDGTASAGSSANWSRGDHVHPHDTSKQDALSATQLSAVNSGVTAAKVAEWDAIEVPTKTSELTNDSGYITAASVPTKTSELVNDSGFITSAPVSSVNGQTGAVSLDAADVGALPDNTAIPTKTSDLTNDSGFITQSAIPSVPTASTAMPAMDGTASAGSSANWSRGDHVHPHDTAKQDALTSSQLAAVNSGITADDLAINDASVLCTAPTIPVTLLAGTTNATLGGCFYYKVGHKVHLHLAINGLTSATTTTVCNMPAGYRPIVTFASVCLGTNYTSYSRVRVQGKDSATAGDVMVNGSGSGAMIDLEYEAFG